MPLNGLLEEHEGPGDFVSTLSRIFNQQLEPPPVFGGRCAATDPKIHGNELWHACDHDFGIVLSECSVES